MKNLITKLTMLLTVLLPVTASAYIDGTVPAAGSFPFTVAMPKLTCTASKIGPKRFLLAAHCLANRGPFIIYKPGDQIEILGQGKDGKLFLERSIVKRAVVHHSYMGAISVNFDPDQVVVTKNVIDLAVIDIEDETNIPVGKLNTTELKVKDPIIVGGFGCTSFDEDVASKYLEHTVVYHTAEKSIAKVNDIIVTASSQDLGSKKKSNACGGDSGGPVYKMVKNQLTIVGVNSYLDDQLKLNFVKLSNKEVIKWLNNIK